jgi:hypothetical protein
MPTLRGIKMEKFDREIVEVVVKDTAFYPTTDRPQFGGTVLIEMATSSGEAGGPQVRVDVAVETQDDMSISDLQNALMERALMLVTRVAEESTQSLRSIWIRTCDHTNKGG